MCVCVCVQKQPAIMIKYSTHKYQNDNIMSSQVSNKSQINKSKQWRLLRKMLMYCA